MNPKDYLSSDPGADVRKFIPNIEWDVLVQYFTYHRCAQLRNTLDFDFLGIRDKILTKSLFQGKASLPREISGILHNQANIRFIYGLILLNLHHKNHDQDYKDVVKFNEEAIKLREITGQNSDRSQFLHNSGLSISIKKKGRTLLELSHPLNVNQILDLLYEHYSPKTNSLLVKKFKAKNHTSGKELSQRNLNERIYKYLRKEEPELKTKIICAKLIVDLYRIAGAPLSIQAKSLYEDLEGGK